MKTETQEFYDRMKILLDDTNTFPTKYLFKFIVPNDVNNLVNVMDCFNGTDAVFAQKESKSGKFSSVSINVTMPSSESIIDVYQKVSTINGIISL
jgi:putative lipoic acid-binding regulatory protein